MEEEGDGEREGGEGREAGREVSLNSDSLLLSHSFKKCSYLLLKSLLTFILCVYGMCFVCKWVQRSTSDAIPQELSTLVFLLRQVSHQNRGLKRGLTSVLKRFSSLYLFSTRVRSMHHHAWIFMWVLGIELRPSYGKASTLLMELPLVQD